MEIYRKVHAQQAMFVWTNLEPKTDDLEVNTKGYFVNMKVTKALKDLPGVFVGRMDDLCLRNWLTSSHLTGTDIE